MLQNIFHPKNNQRTDAIKNSKNYVEIWTTKDAVDFLSKTLSQNLKQEFSSRETAIRQSMQSDLASEAASLFINAPDIYYAAAVMIMLQFYMGRGDRSQILNAIFTTPQVQALKEKLQLI